jgi:hypothetical protein
MYMGGALGDSRDDQSTYSEASRRTLDATLVGLPWEEIHPSVRSPMERTPRWSPVCRIRLEAGRPNQEILKTPPPQDPFKRRWPLSLARHFLPVHSSFLTLWEYMGVRVWAVKLLPRVVYLAKSGCNPPDSPSGRILLSNRIRIILVTVDGCPRNSGNISSRKSRSSSINVSARQTSCGTFKPNSMSTLHEASLTLK